MRRRADTMKAGFDPISGLLPVVNGQLAEDGVGIAVDRVLAAAGLGGSCFIVNGIENTSRLAYDVSSMPPATIGWEEIERVGGSAAEPHRPSR